jgi:hypothetical protein
VARVTSQIWCQGVSMSKIVALLVLVGFLGRAAEAQSQANLFDAIMNSAVSNIPVVTANGTQFTIPGALPTVYGDGNTSTPPSNLNCALTNAKAMPAGCFSTRNTFTGLQGALNSSIATALSTLPLASPASGVILRIDAATGAELPASSTLGPIFTERAETIGKRKFYIGFSNQDFHFTSFNGGSLNQLTLLDPGGVPSSTLGGLTSLPATYTMSVDVHLSQDVTFLTYGVTNRFDVSLGLPVVHASLTSQTSTGLIYAGSGFGALPGGPAGSSCWCLSTFTPGGPPGAPGSSNGLGLILPINGQAGLGRTGFGDMLLRLKGTVFDSSSTVLALGTDVRFPTGDAENFLGTGAMAVKPFVALSLYSTPLSNGIVFSPHVNVGWQIEGKSVLGGLLSSTAYPMVTPNGSFTYYGAPFTPTRDYLPDMLSWAVGTEVALGKHNTVVVDMLGNQIGLIHGIQNMVAASAPGYSPLTFSSTTATTASGLVPTTDRVSYGQYSGSFGYKLRIADNLVATFNMLVRFDSNGLTDRVVPLVGLSYSLY